jgi:general secretion pathway protein E
MSALQGAGLPAAAAPWRLDFEQWHPGDAQRWRAVLAVAADGRRALLADRDKDPLLLQAVESRLAAPVRWHRVAAETLDPWLSVGESAFRALDLVRDDSTDNTTDETTHRSGGDSTRELSAAGVSEAGSPVVRLLDATLLDALKAGASDIHIECSARGADIRYRIDGVLAAVHGIEGARTAEQLVSRLKVMAELDIGERRLPQDGRFKLRVQAREVDFRLSIMPSVFGEDAVLRVLDRVHIERTQGGLTLDALGFAPEMRAAIRQLAKAPHGMLLVTGPTGSGKTTTLYAVLTETHSDGDKTITIEDPVEYQLKGATQIPVNDRKGLGFARGLRSVLRHDPDRIMVGEIRDAETAEIAVQAALTGHVVFSTVHANGAFDVVGRFLHLGLDPYNIVSALNGVLAQRLVRQLCPLCAEADPAAGPHAQRAVGCLHCRHTGYRGRRAVAEVLRLDDELRDLVAGRAPLSQLKDAARRKGFRRLREAALALVQQGHTSMDEADRVAPEA